MNHGRVFNHWHYNQNNQQNQKINKKSKPGGSRPSTPGTNSTNSSVRSQGRRCKADKVADQSIEILIGNVLNYVSDGRYTRKTRKIHVNMKCRDCTTEALCKSCLMNQQLYRLANVRISEAQYAPVEIMNEQMTTSDTTSANHLCCNIHRNINRYYCQTCCCPICDDCTMYIHYAHTMIPLIKAIDDAKIQAAEVMQDATLGMESIKLELANIQIAAESLEQKAQQATTDVLTCMRKVALALEERQKALLKHIEKARALKFSILRARDDMLKRGLMRLSQSIQNIDDAMQNTSANFNPLNLIHAKDIGAAEVFQLRQARYMLPPTEENWISYSQPEEDDLLHMISTLGFVKLNSPGFVGDRRALVGRGNCTQVPPYHPPNGPVNIGPSTAPGGRAIALCNFPVITKLNYSSFVSVEKSIGNSSEKEEDNLCRPWGVACDGEGHVIIADRSNNRIQVYSENGTFVRRFGSYGRGPCQFNRPAGLTVDKNRRLVVSDKDNHRIQVLTLQGSFLFCFGERGYKCGQFYYPWDVATNSNCQIVVSDTRNHRVQLFSAEGIFLRKYGFENSPSMWKFFDMPRGVAFCPNGNVVTTDFNNHRLFMIDSNFLNSQILGCSPDERRMFARPQGLVIDDEGSIVVSDCRLHRIRVFDSFGISKFTIDNKCKDEHDIDRPSGIALRPDGRIVVVDLGNNRAVTL